MNIHVAPSSPPQNLLVTDINSSSIHIGWSPPIADQQNGPISHYTVVLYSHQTGESIYYNVSYNFLSISHLHPFYTYNCSVSAFTVAPGPSTAVSFQTAEDGKILMI